MVLDRGVPKYDTKNVTTHPVIFFDLYFLNFNSYGVNRIRIFTRETTKLGSFRICFVYTNNQSKLLLPAGDKTGYCLIT